MKVILKGHGKTKQSIELESVEIKIGDSKFSITSDKHSQYSSNKDDLMLLIQTGRLGEKLAIQPIATNIVRVKIEK